MSSRGTPVNPFDNASALAQSNYCVFDGRRLARDGDGPAPTPLTEFVHHGFRSLILNERFSCIGAKAALRQGSYSFGLYDEFASERSSAGLARDLFTFVHASDPTMSEFRTFVAGFAAPLPPDESTFERLLWTTLQQLNDLDTVHHDWDWHSSADTSDPKFSFSFAGTAFFVVGLHAGSSRITRRFAWPTLVFNPHQQFDRLRETGHYERFQQIIRSADRSLQGDINPMLADFGRTSEASQYSGRQVDGEWRCPFRAGERPTRRADKEGLSDDPAAD